MYFYEPKNGHGLKHSPFKAIIAPRPIGWISTVDAESRVNLAPYSFFNAVSELPPMLAFSSYGWKDSVRNIRDTKEFVFSLVTKKQAEQMNVTADPLPHGTSEFEAAKLRALPSNLVRPPRVEGSPAAMECKLVSIQQLNDIDGVKTESILIIGQVVGVHIMEEYIENGVFNILKAGTIARCGYKGDYTQVDNLFELTRPT
jgi:flavin reductase (DIM6/NTAB) family NADH-FMN oxidoreductase RutF